MKKYQILQGKFTSSGCGDYTIIAEFDTLKKAKSAFNDLKDDTNGWNLSPHEVLETLIIEYYTVKGVR